VKILVLNWQDLANPQSGGAEIHLHEIFGRLAARGHEVTLLCSGWAGARARAENSGIQIHRAGGRNTYSLAAPRYFRRHLASTPWDVVVEDLNKVPLFAPYWVRRPLVLLVHHLFGATAFREASAPFAAATWLLERPISRVYRGLPTQAVSESTADDLVDRGLRREDIRIIHNGVDLGFFQPAPSVPRGAEPMFVSVGRLRRYKRIDHVIQAVARLKASGRYARLRIAGRGPDEARLRETVARLGVGELVSFEGFVSEEQKRDLMRRAWATVQASPKEGWGITNMEAAACGTPTIASDSPGLRESVVHGETGFLYPHGDIDALAAAIDRLAADRARVESLGAGALAFAQRFTWDRAADLTEAHLAEVAGQGSAGRGRAGRGTGER
jgi:glycosyltransferase involved in cell wall biosynthesis